MSASDDNHDRICCHDPVFAHARDPRAAASVTLAGMIGALIASALIAISAPLTEHAPNPQLAAAVPAAVAPPKPIRVVGKIPAQELACEQQTWPYIHQRCLIRAESKPRTEAQPRPTDVSLVARDSAELSPLTATGSAVAPQATR